MALINCRECGKEVSNEAESCPHCGIRQIQKKRGFLATMFNGLIIVTVVFTVWNIFLSDLVNSPPQKQTTPKQKAPKKKASKQKPKDMIQFYLNNIDYRASVTAAGKPCPNVTHKSWTGKDEGSGKRFVSVSCSDGSNYMVSLPANDDGMIRVTECELMESLTGVSCFDKLNDKY
jgi:DNA-directed RNA polymerase subunit RPC12/RpoP